MQFHYLSKSWINKFRSSLLLKNSVISLVFQVIPITIAIIFIPINILHLGLELWGLYSLAITLFFLVMYLNFGIGPSVNRLVSEYRSKMNFVSEKNLVHTSFFISLLLCFLLYIFFKILDETIVYFIFSESDFTKYESGIRELFNYIYIGSCIYLQINFFRNVIEGQQLFLFVSFTRAIFASFLIISPLLTSKELINFSGLYINILLSIIISLYFIIFIKDYGFPNIKKFSNIQFKKIIYQGSLISLHSFFNPIFIFLDRYVISSLLGLFFVGIYTSFYDIISRLTIISSSISSALFPSASSNIENKSKLKDSVFFSLFLTSILTAIPTIILLIYGPQIISIWLKQDYPIEYSYLIRILCSAYFIQGLNLVLLKTMQATKNFKFPVYLSLVLSIFYVPSLFFSIKFFGITGAGLIFLIKNIIEFCLSIIFFKRRIV
tara:strand:+ start:5830 stop:7137 length:1308 start_codon:yes stop_codon:yes gene_type:complete